MPPDWFLDEVACAGAEHLDADFVAGYDRKAGVDPVDDVAELRSHGMTANATVIDMGAGTGRFTIAAAPHCRKIIAIDVSQPMLDHLRRRAAEARLTNIELVQAGFLSYDHVGPPADVVYSRNALHHLPDFWKGLALSRLAGMLRPGGILRLRDLIYDFRPEEADAVIERWLAGATSDSALGYTSCDLVEHIRSEHSTYRWLLEPILAAAGFEIVEVDFDRSVYGRYTCVKR